MAQLALFLYSEGALQTAALPAPLQVAFGLAPVRLSGPAGLIDYITIR